MDFLFFIFDTDPAQFPEGAADCISTILRKVTPESRPACENPTGCRPPPPFLYAREGM